MPCWYWIDSFFLEPIERILYQGMLPKLDLKKLYGLRSPAMLGPRCPRQVPGVRVNVEGVHHMSCGGFRQHGSVDQLAMWMAGSKALPGAGCGRSPLNLGSINHKSSLFSAGDFLPARNPRAKGKI